MLFRHLARVLESGKAELPERLVGQDGDGVGEVQAARLGAHGKADAAAIVRHTEVLRQSCGLLAEKEPAAVVKFRLAVVLRRLRRGKPAVPLRFGVPPKEIAEVFIYAYLDQMPVVQPRALDRAVGNIKAEGLDEVQPRAGRGAGARDVAAVLRDLRLHKDDIEHKASHLFPKVCLLYLAKFTKSTIKPPFINIILRVA